MTRAPFSQKPSSLIAFTVVSKGAWAALLHAAQSRAISPATGFAALHAVQSDAGLLSARAF